MKTTIFRSLLWKDTRLNLSVLLLGLVAWVGPYAMIASYRLATERQIGAEVDRPWSVDMAGGAGLSLGFTIMTGLLLGASAFATERSDRSAEFLALLPATRGQIVGSKLLVALVPLAIIWAVNLAVIYAVDRTTDFRELLPIAGVLLTFFGVSWFGSSFLDRPLTALGLPLFLLFAFILGGAALNQFVPRADARRVIEWEYALFVLLGAAGFVAGTWIALRRVEP